MALTAGTIPMQSSTPLQLVDTPLTYDIGANALNAAADKWSDSYGTVSAGNSNHADSYGTVSSGGDSNHADSYGTVSAGVANHADSYGAVSGGTSNHADSSSTVSGGDYNHADSYGNVIAGDASSASGSYSNARFSFTQCRGHGVTSRQFIRAGLGVQTTDDTPTPLLNGSNDAFIGPIPDGYAWGVTSTIVGVDDSGVVTMFVRRTTIKNIGGTTSIGTTNTVGTDINPGSYTVAISADDTNDGIAVTVTGHATNPINWHAVLEINEVIIPTV